MDVKFNKYTELDQKLLKLRPYIEKIVGRSILSVNASIGNTYQDFVNIKQVSLSSPDDFKSRYFLGWGKRIRFIIERSKTSKADCYKDLEQNNEYRFFKLFLTDNIIHEYVMLFLERSYYDKYKEYTRIKPNLEEILWIGDNKKVLGIGITPRFSNGEWENDKSEVRKVEFEYWTIGHILNTGFLTPHVNQKTIFSDINEYLEYFIDFVKSSSNSPYEIDIAQKYKEYVIENKCPSEIPLLIPQFRYAGLEYKHIYRLDFLIIDPVTQIKYGFELSPYSTHGDQKNYENDNNKRLSFQKKYDMIYNTFTNTQLRGLLFNEFKQYLDLKHESKNILAESLEKLKQLAEEVGL